MCVAGTGPGRCANSVVGDTLSILICNMASERFLIQILSASKPHTGGVCVKSAEISGALLPPIGLDRNSWIISLLLLLLILGFLISRLTLWLNTYYYTIIYLFTQVIMLRFSQTY